MEPFRDAESTCFCNVSTILADYTALQPGW